MRLHFRKKVFFLLLIFILPSLHVGASTKKVVVVSYGKGMPPYSYLDQQNELIGSDIELLKKVLDRIGYSLSYIKDIPIKRMHSHNKDLGFNANLAAAYTDERSLQYYFSNPYRSEEIGVFYVNPKFDALTSFNDYFNFADNIALNTVGQYGKQLQVLIRKYQHKIIHSETTFNRLKQLSKNRVDLVLGEVNKTRIVLEKHKFKSIKMSSLKNTKQDVHFIFKKSEFDKDFLSKFNQALALERPFRSNS